MPESSLPPPPKPALEQGERFLKVWDFYLGLYRLSIKHRVVLTDRRLIVQGVAVRQTGLLGKGMSEAPGLDGRWRTMVNKPLGDIYPPKIQEKQHWAEVQIGEFGMMFDPSDMEEAQAMVEQIERVRIPESPPGPAVVKETIKEIVKVPCSYCRTLNLVTDAKCSSCGAPLR